MEYTMWGSGVSSSSGFVKQFGKRVQGREMWRRLGDKGSTEHDCCASDRHLQTGGGEGRSAVGAAGGRGRPSGRASTRSGARTLEERSISMQNRNAGEHKKRGRERPGTASVQRHSRTPPHGADALRPDSELKRGTTLTEEALGAVLDGWDAVPEPETEPEPGTEPLTPLVEATALAETEPLAD